MSNCGGLENFYYNIDDPITCSNAFNGYPKDSTVIYEYLDEVPKPSKFDKCSYSTIYGASWDQVLTFKWDICKGKIYSNKSGNFKIKGVANTSGNTLKYWAAAPNTCTYSVCGYGLPFPNEEIAYENTPNKGEVKLGSGGSFEIVLKYPSGYYVNQGEIYVPPHVNFKLCDSNAVSRVHLPVETPFRSLGFNLDNPAREWQPVPYKKL